ncbi:Z1 domain-containing protein [Micromonospora sp. WMMD712]|uniref:Z1 domain-containing protein n=1 Tax=Micromonospora sp. WMMD712 TaxID=3016096 RepID=UPI00249A6ECE|nr:Z1 domain-containing protein [Micromonospora sp. WMMD712]WFE59527.1 Z1 domain-containing protein [Micromonospora sp. WMMD712]
MSDTVTTGYSSALDGMKTAGPGPLHQFAALFARDTSLADGAALLAHLQNAGPDDALRQRLAYQLSSWDHTDDGPWAAGTAPHTAERRAAACRALGLDRATEELLSEIIPWAATDAPIVIAEHFEEWRTPQRRTERDFYWAHYSANLLANGWDPTAVAGIDEATEEVVRRISDPTRKVAYQAKGLVVGYVQSGKTANFTGVIAKAIDAGYRMVIVLTGTTNMLRAQTQRRLDMELCGRENIEPDHDPTAHEYRYDDDWKRHKFINHGGRPSDSGHPDIERLSNYAGDYQRLKQGISALRFKRHDSTKEFFHPANLYTSDARLVVAKKNASVLTNLVADLKKVSARLGEIPVLIIDDESDQASVNTTSPAKWKEDSKKRTAINRLIAQLLTMLPRAQYVGYTATPYANVFIDPSDVEDIFPKDFIVSLPRPLGYMGADDFHDFDDDRPVGQRPLETSKERAHVRWLSDESTEPELLAALDMYVLTGALKLYRKRTGAGTYRHHTMLVHEAMGQESHRETAQLIERLWTRAGYHTPTGLLRIRKLYETDVLPVTTAQAPGAAMPGSFDELHDDIAGAVGLIQPNDRHGTPVIIVNSDPDLEKHQEDLDFDKRGVWRILVGGNKLARGFTVEGLTVTYYRRTTKQVDTLMQMGRWFGFRTGYRDLVRLYTTQDLHALFGAACEDEQSLRDDLRKYSTETDPESRLTPSRVPPLVEQHRPDLRPTGRNKMWNARLVSRSTPGEPMEPVAHPEKGKQALHNLRLWEPVLAAAAAADPVTLRVSKGRTSYPAHHVTMPHHEMMTILNGLQWLREEIFVPERTWLNSLAPTQLRQWVVLLPQQVDPTTCRMILGHGPFSIFERKRSDTGTLSAISESRHRNAAARIAGLETAQPDPVADTLAAPCTAVLTLYPSVKPKTLAGARGDRIDPGLVTMAFRAVTPLSTGLGSKRLIWTTKDSGRPNHVVIDAAPAV